MKLDDVVALLTRESLPRPIAARCPECRGTLRRRPKSGCIGRCHGAITCGNLRERLKFKPFNLA